MSLVASDTLRRMQNTQHRFAAAGGWGSSLPLIPGPYYSHNKEPPLKVPLFSFISASIQKFYMDMKCTPTCTSTSFIFYSVTVVTVIVEVMFYIQCFQLSDIINLVWACRKELSHQTS